MIKPSRYRFHTDRTTYIWSAMHLFIIGVIIAMLAIGSGASYFSAWFLSLFIAIFALMTISIPRTVEVDNESIIINCILDIVDIPLDNILLVRKVSPRKIRWVVPIYGGCGFFGYYGHFFDFRRMERVKIYATEWNHLVEVIDIHEDRFYISCSKRDELIAHIEAARSCE